MTSKNKILSFFLAIINFSVGYAQRDYIVNFLNPKLKLFENREEFGRLATYTFNDLITGTDPRFYSMLIYALLTFGSSIGFVFLFFTQKKYTKIAFLIYSGAYLVAILFAGLAKFDALKFLFELSQEIKNSLSSSFFLLFLIALFLFDKKQNESK
jgi:hypothetical protein